MISLFILVLGCLGSQNILAGTVYQWTDETGNVHFSDVPPDGSITVETHEIIINQPALNDVDLEKYSIINQAEQMAEWRRQLTEERLAKRRLYLEEKRLLQELELSKQANADAEEYPPQTRYYVPYHFPHRLGHRVNNHPHQTQKNQPVNVIPNRHTSKDG